MRDEERGWQTRRGVEGQFPGDMVGSDPDSRYLPVAGSWGKWREEEKGLMQVLDEQRRKEEEQRRKEEEQRRKEEERKIRQELGATHVFGKGRHFYIFSPGEGIYGEADVARRVLEVPIYVRSKKVRGLPEGTTAWEVVNREPVEVLIENYGRRETIVPYQTIYGCGSYQPRELEK